MTTKPRDDGPIPPIPPVGPPQKIETFLTALKVFAITDIGYALKYAWNVNQSFTDFHMSTSLDHWSYMLKVSVNGFVYGLIPGGIVAMIVLLAAWAGPELWTWLGPIVVAAYKNSMNAIRGFARAFRGQADPSDKSDKETGKNG